MGFTEGDSVLNHFPPCTNVFEGNRAWVYVRKDWLHAPPSSPPILTSAGGLFWPTLLCADSAERLLQANESDKPIIPPPDRGRDWSPMPAPEKELPLGA